jgi:glycosyltransferase involved in cell wall biosynthesis
MKILFICSWSPYPTMSGGRRRSRQVIEFLDARHELEVISFSAGPGEREALRGKGTAVPYQYDHRNNSLPPSIWPFESTFLKELLMEKQAEGFQATIFDQLFSTCFVKHSCGTPVLMEQNIESQILRRLAATAQGHQKRLLLAQFMALRAYESRIWPEFPIRTCVSEVDAKIMRENCPTGEVVVVPNGVDLERARLLDLEDSSRLLFVGALDYGPNQDAVERLCTGIMPLLWRRDPAFKLRVMGRNPNQAVSDLMAADSRLELMANVPELEEPASQCCMSLVPLRAGSGTRLKILEASAWGMPVVTTPMGCEGLSQELIDCLCLADSDEALAETVWDLRKNPQRRIELAEKARAVVCREYEWSKALEPLQQALLKLERSL